MAGLVSVFLVHSLGSRLFSSADWWKWFLYLTSWARLLSALHYVTEAVLVSLRWRREQGGWLFVTSEYCHDICLSQCPPPGRCCSQATPAQTRASPRHTACFGQRPTSTATRPPSAPSSTGCSFMTTTTSSMLTTSLAIFSYSWSTSSIFLCHRGKAIWFQTGIISNTLNTRPWRVLHVYHVQLFCLVYVMSNLAYIEGGGTNLSDQPYIYSILDWNQPAV